MRFISYLHPETKKKINEIKSMRIKLIETPVDYSIILNEISEKYNMNIEIYNTINELNKELKTIYKGKYVFALCIDEGIILDKVKINKRYVRKMKMAFFDADDKLAKMKREIENKVKLDNQKGQG